MMVLGLFLPSWMPLSTSGQLYADTFNQYVNYQGKLYNAAGTSTVSNGIYSIDFNLYTVSTGGVAIWTETQTPTTVDGLFSVSLGSITPLNRNQTQKHSKKIKKIMIKSL